MNVPSGFLFAGLAAGIKPHRKDVALVYSKVPATAAACFTINKAKAAPILDAEKRVPSPKAHAVLINSGNANALTGPAGVEAVRVIREALGAQLNIPADAILTASTGVIGVPPPTAKITAALPNLCKGLSVSPVAAAEAIMTTDTRIKMSSRKVIIDRKEVTLSAICKGSGMIAPQLATMIAVFVTDCAMSEVVLQEALTSVLDESFNALTVDNDMSTNDAIFALANGLAGNTPVQSGTPDYLAFRTALLEISQDLSRDIAADGEGATKRLDVEVSRAPSQAIALDIARSIAGSSLVKAAIFGADPNWGRVLATVGARAGSQGYAVSPYAAKVTIQGIVVYNSAPTVFEANELRAKMREPIVSVMVELGAGEHRAVAWGCDLSYDYVKINADYTSLVVSGPDGAVRKDDRFTNYSPKFKVSILKEALTYINTFRGKRCVIKVGSKELANEALKHAFVQDIALLRSVGLIPIVVHGGDEEIRRTMGRLGTGGAASESELVEMVVNGKINVELVSLLNKNGVNAVGLSGKDANFLTAVAAKHESPHHAFRTGELTEVKGHLVNVLIEQGYLPVVAPTGVGPEGDSYHLSGDDVAAGVAVALDAQKLIYLTDGPGIMAAGELIERLPQRQFEELLDTPGGITESLVPKAAAAKSALRGGVSQVHFVDGRMPHGVLAELFTDNGIGTLVQREA